MESIHHIIQQYRDDKRVPLTLLALMGLFFVIYFFNWISAFHIDVPQNTLVMERPIQSISPPSQWHFFGTYNNSLDNLPETSLNLTLEGVMLDMANPAHSYVIISSPSTPSSPYKVGDSLPGGATLVKILQQEVVIHYQGQNQSLNLPVDQL